MFQKIWIFFMMNLRISRLIYTAVKEISGLQNLVRNKFLTELKYARRILLENNNFSVWRPEILGLVFFFFLTFCWPCISVFNQLDAQNLFHNKLYFVPLHVSSICAHHHEVKIALYSLWYHHIYKCDDTRGCVIQFSPPDDEHICSKHVEAWNKTYCETNVMHQIG